MRRLTAALLAAGFALATPAAALAADCPQTSVADLEDEVMCPVCGTTLAVATEPPQARRERAFIQQLVDQCKSKDEIKDALTAEFGDEVLATPSDGGADLAAWGIPALGLAAGAGGVAFAAIRWRRRRGDGDPPETSAQSPAPSPADAARLDADLERYDL